MEQTKIKIISKGLGFGSCLAMVISWSLNSSVMWAILHGIFGWMYVLYYLMFKI